MKKLIFLLFIFIFLTCSTLSVGQNVSVKEYNSPVEFNREMRAIGKQNIHIKVSEKISPSNNWNKDILFYDVQGNIRKRISINRSDKQELAWLDKQHKRMVISRPHIFGGAYPGAIKGVVPGIQKVYDFDGNLLLDFKNTEYWLRPFMENFYLGSTEGDEMSHREKSALIGLGGNIIKDVEGLHIPVVRAVSDSIGIVEDVVQATYWAFDYKGDILWKKAVPVASNIIGISGNNRISIGFLDKDWSVNILLLDQKGNELNKILVDDHVGGIFTKLSDSGKYLFWAYIRSFDPQQTEAKYIEFVLYDLEVQKTVWKKTNEQDISYNYSVFQIGFSSTEQLIYVNLPGLFICLNIAGEVINQQLTNNNNWPDKIDVFVENNMLSIFHKETQKITSLFFQE